MCRTVLEEHTDASRPTHGMVLARVAARLDQQYGPGRVPVPGRSKAYAVLAEITRGTNAFTGSTKAKQSIANRPVGVYGRLRATRPGEYLLLDTTRLDVFAMEPITLRWARAELTIALDLYTRCIAGLRLTPVSTRSIDAAAVLFEALQPPTTPGTRAAGSLTAPGAIPRWPYRGVPRAAVVDANLLADKDGQPLLPSVAPETVVVDHGKLYVSGHLTSVCARLGISIQPARPYTPTDKAPVERFFRTLGEGCCRHCRVTRARTCTAAAGTSNNRRSTSSTSWSRSSASGSRSATTPGRMTGWRSRRSRAWTSAPTRCTSTGSSEQERPVAPRAAADVGYASSAGGVSPFAANPARTISSSARCTPATSTPVSAARSSGGYGPDPCRSMTCRIATIVSRSWVCSASGSSSRISRSSHAVSCPASCW